MQRQSLPNHCTHSQHHPFFEGDVSCQMCSGGKMHKISNRTMVIDRGACVDDYVPTQLDFWLDHDPSEDHSPSHDVNTGMDPGGRMYYLNPSKRAYFLRDLLALKIVSNRDQEAVTLDVSSSVDRAGDRAPEKRLSPYRLVIVQDRCYLVSRCL